MEKMWFSIKNKTEDSKDVDIYIYDEIGSHDVNAKAFIEELKKYKGKTLNIHINSLGGEVFDGMAIANAIKSHNAPTNTFIEGICASISTIVALASDKVYMSENSLFMIHNAWGGSMGVAKDLRKQADILEKISNEIANVYIKRTNLSKDKIQAMMEEETWLTATESIEAGFVDELTEALKMVAQYDVSKFKNITEEKINLILNKKSKEIMSKNSEDKSILEKIKNIFAESSDITPKALEEEEEIEQEEEKIEDAEEMPDWYKKTYEEMKDRVQNLEDAVADLKEDKENAKAELVDALGQLETSNETIVAMGTEMAKLGATPTHLSPQSDPSPVKVENKVDANTDSFNALADLLKSK